MCRDLCAYVPGQIVSKASAAYFCFAVAPISYWVEGDRELLPSHHSLEKKWLIRTEVCTQSPFCSRFTTNKVNPMYPCDLVASSPAVPLKAGRKKKTGESTSFALMLFQHHDAAEEIAKKSHEKRQSWENKTAA